MRLYSLSVSSALVALLTLLGGCSTLADWVRQRPQPLPPAADLYTLGEAELSRSRYADARALGDDLRCFLDRRPVQARPPERASTLPE